MESIRMEHVPAWARSRFNLLQYYIDLTDQEVKEMVRKATEDLEKNSYVC